MPRRIEHELTYDAPLSEVAAMLADPAFREEVCDHQKVLRFDVTVEDGDGTTRVVIDQVHPAAGLPSFATRLVGDEINIVQREVWTAPDRAGVEVTIPGKPGEMTGTATLTESDGTTTERVDLTVRVGIPLVGGKIEKLIGDMLVRALEAENTVGRRWLAR